jgi:hypothetical protein
MSRSDSSRNKISEETESSVDLLGAIDGAIEKMRVQLTGGPQAGTLSDLVKLLQLRKELDGDRPRHISARWISEDEC